MIGIEDYVKHKNGHREGQTRWKEKENHKRFFCSIFTKD